MQWIKPTVWHDHSMVFGTKISLYPFAIQAASLIDVLPCFISTDKTDGFYLWVVANTIHGWNGAVNNVENARRKTYKSVNAVITLRNSKADLLERKVRR